MKKFLLSILCCLMAVVNGYADEYSYTFTSKQYSANGAKTLGGVEWTLAGDGGYWGYDGTKGQQFGSKNATYKSMTFSTSGLAGKITKIVINTSGASDVKASFTVSVGGTQYGNSTKLTATATDYTFTGTSSGDIEFAYTQTSSKALYIKSITITYETDEGGEGGSSEEPETPVVPTAPTLTAPCSFVNSMDVEITNIPEGATVYYTTDGTDPSTSNTEYSAPFEITATTTVKAIAVNEAGSSDVVSATYTKKEIIEGQVEDIITIDLIGETGNSYTSWSDKRSNSTAVYAGQSISNPNNIQLRSDKDKENNYSGIVTTTSGGKVKKIIVEWGGATANGRTLNIYGKNDAYSNPNDLYDNTKSGTKLGTIVKGTSTELEITGDYRYIGLRSNSGAMYITSITIIWEQPYTLNITDVGYATFTADKNFIIPAGVEGGIVTVEGTTANVNYVYTGGEIVPAGTGLLMKGAKGVYEMATTEEDAAKVYTETENLLRGALDNNPITAPGNLLYIFAKDDSKSGLGFYWQYDSDNGQRVKNMKGKAYLQVPTTSAVKGFRLNLGDTTGITAVETTNGNAPVYTLSGVRVNGSLNNLPAGIYIVGGKKVYVK